jgi:hypothetical protein
MAEIASETMPDTGPTNVPMTHEDLRAAVRRIALILTGIWASSAVVLLGGVTGAAGGGFAILMIALAGAPLFFFFILPALIYCQWGGPSGPKVAAGLLLAGLAFVVAFLAWLSGTPTFR